MTCSLSSVLTFHRSVQLKLNTDVNWTIKLSQKQIRANTKQNGIRWCQQCNIPGAIGRIERDLLKGYEMRTNYVKNTTSTRTSHAKNKYKGNNPNIAYVSWFIKVDDNKTRMKWHKILGCGSEQAAEILQSMTKLNSMENKHQIHKK